MPKTQNKKTGRPEIELASSQKLTAVQYVQKTGLWKIRLAKFLKIDRGTLDRILKNDPTFSTDLEAADAQFCGKTIQKAKPEFILKTKYKDEFPEDTKIGVEHSYDEKLKEFLDRASLLTNARRRESNANVGEFNDT